MKILMLVNWNVKYTKKKVENEQPMNNVVQDEPYWFFKYFKNIPDVDVIDTHSIPALEKLEKYRLRFYVLQAVKAIPKLKKYDLIISHGMQSGIVCALWRRLFPRKTKHLVFDIGTFNSAAEHGKAMQLMQFASKSIDGLIYHSSWQKTYYKKYYPWIADKATFIPFGIDPSVLEHEPTLKYEGIDKSNPYILCIGKSHCDWKTVVEAYEKIDTNTQLVLLGGEDERFKGKNNVIMLPYVSFDELLDLINLASFCILPIENVKFSFGQIRLLQQMAMGKCVIIPEAISLVDYATDKVSALYYKPEDVESCRLALQIALSEKKLVDAIGKKAQQEVYTRFTEEQMAFQIEEKINKMLEEA